MSNGSGEDPFTRKYIIWPLGIWPWPQGQGHMKCCLVPSTSCDLCQGKNLKLLLLKHYEQMRFQENTLFDLDLHLGVKVTQNVAQYPWHDVTYAQAKFKVATSKSLWGDAFTRKYIIRPWPWGQGHTKCHPVPSTSCDLCTYKIWSCYVQRFRRRYNYKKRDGRTDGQTDRRTDGRTDGRTTDRLWYEINIPYFSYEKAGIIRDFYIRISTTTWFTLHALLKGSHSSFDPSQVENARM